MKNIVTALCFIAMATLAFAQAPQGINYQAVARNNAGAVLANQSIGLRLSIREAAANGPTIYTETHTATTNQFGLFTVVVGSGTVTQGTFAGINWGNGNGKFLRVELDAAGGTNYTDMGTTQLQSVPYALYAGSSADNRWAESSNNIYNTNSGNVGIGIANPDYKLHVADSTGITQVVGIEVLNKGNGNARLLATNQDGSWGGLTKFSPTTLGTIAGIPTGNLMELYNADGNMVLDVYQRNIYFATNGLAPAMVISPSAVGIGTAAPAPSAALEVNSTTGGVLLPRLTTAQRNAISAPTPGLLIYNTDLGKFQGYAVNGASSFVGAADYTGGTFTYVANDGMMQNAAAQSFQVTQAGLLDSISFNALGFVNGTGPMTVNVQVHEGTPAAPGNLLGSATVTVTAAGRYTVALPGNITLATGTNYWFEITSTTSSSTYLQIERTGTGAGPYALGSLWYYDILMGYMQSGDDLWFEVKLKSISAWVDLH